MAKQEPSERPRHRRGRERDELARRARNSARARDDLFTRDREIVVRTILSWLRNRYAHCLAGRSRIEVEETAFDIAADAFMVAYEKFDDSQSLFSTFWLEVAKFKLKEWERRLIRAGSPVDPDAAPEQADPASLGGRTFDEALLRSDVEEVLRDLDADERTVFWLVEMEGHTYDQAAEELDCHPADVRRTIRRARTHFKSAWIRHFGRPG